MSNNCSPHHSDALLEKLSQVEKENAQYRSAIQDLTMCNDIQESLNIVMRISMAPMGLYEIQEKILESVLDIEWLSLEKKGCIFNVNEDNVLTMVAHKNLPDALLTKCNKVPFGDCLCGKAAQNNKFIFKGCLDDDHTYRPGKVTPHGHYNVPINDSHGNVLGVLNLYVKDGHKQRIIETTFLSSVSKILGFVIERKRLEDELTTLSLTDSLTGIANRRQFLTDLEKAISRSKRLDKKFGVLFIDLDKFKPINDEYGHEAGDHVLMQFAQRLKKITREHDTIARLGGDEFIMIADCIEDEASLLAVQSRILEATKAPFQTGVKAFKVNASVGYSIFPDHGDTVDALINQADKSMYTQKRAAG